MKDTGRGAMELIVQQIKGVAESYRGPISQSGVSENEFWIWYTLTVMEGEYTQQDICEAWYMSKQTVNTIVSHMTRDGYVILETVPGGRNRKTLRLTEAGLQRGKAIVEPIVRAEEKTVERIPEQVRQAWLDASAEYIKIFKEEIGRVQ